MTNPLRPSRRNRMKLTVPTDEGSNPSKSSENERIKEKSRHADSIREPAGEKGSNMPRGRKKAKYEVEDEEEYVQHCKYEDYHNRLDDWRQLSSKDQGHILREAVKRLKQLECLTPKCMTKLSTYNGMEYHLRVCGVPPAERMRVCDVCKKNVQGGDMREHKKRHQEDLESSLLVKGDAGRKQRKSALKALEGFALLSAENTSEKSSAKKKNIKVEASFGFEASDDEDQTDEELAACTSSVTIEEQVTKSGRKQCKKQLDDELIEDGGGDVESDFEESLNVSSTQTKRKHNQKSKDKKHKRFTFLPETFRIDWKDVVAKAFKRIISEDHLKVAFENWIIEKSLWCCLPSREVETYIGRFKDRSPKFQWTTHKFDPVEPAIDLKMLESTVSPSEGAVAFCGAPVVACAWCPIPDSESDQFIALSTHHEWNLCTVVGKMAGCIQLWSATLKDGKCTSLKLELLLAHEAGVVLDLKWCPSGIWQKMDLEAKNGNKTLLRLGALATTSGTGEIFIYGIPHPSNFKRITNEVPVFKAKPLMMLFCGAELVSYSLDWSHFNGHEKLVAGFHDGGISVWNLKKRSKVLRDSSDRLLPISTLSVFNTSVRCVRWHSSTKIITSSVDRFVAIWDVVEGICCFSSNSLQLVVAVGCGPVFPGYLSSAFSSKQMPFYPTYTDAPTEACIMLNRFHQSIIWMFDTSPWNGSVLSVDNQGFVCLSCDKTVPSEMTLKRKFTETIMFRTIYAADDVDFVPLTYDDSMRITLKFVSQAHELKRPTLEKEYTRLEQTGFYPLAALFAVAWNRNESHANWCCFGGQAGFLFLHDTQM